MTDSVDAGREGQPRKSFPFTKPYIAGRELYHIAKAVALGNISGDGFFTQECQRFLQERFDLGTVMMTTSCTSALEMAAILCDLDDGGEVIMPSFTFVSTASAVVRAGGRPVFVDIRPDTFNMDETLIEELITDRTKAILPVHYGGVGCEMDEICRIAEAHGLFVIEDAAMGVNAYYRDRALGSIGQLGCYSFHETKNFVCGEGGALAVNDPALVERAEIIRDKGTNRKQFFRGVVDKYTWVDIGSSYVPSEILCAFLFAQFEAMDAMTEMRAAIHGWYTDRLAPLAADGLLRLPEVPPHCTSNSHVFYVVLPDGKTRNALMEHLHDHGIGAVFHYVPLHSSPMGEKLGCARPLPVTDDLSGRLLRLPLYYELTEGDVDAICAAVRSFLLAR